MGFYTNKNVLVTGGTGLIGKPLVDMLVDQGAKVTVASLDDAQVPEGVTFKRVDLREFHHCQTLCQDQEIVFQLAGIKGSPAMAAKRPASFFVPTLTFSINMMEAARQAGVERFLVTSSIGVYAPASVFYEDDVWTSFPSQNDRFAGWAKRMSELQAEAYKIEYGWKNVAIVRPANVYGPYDNFDPSNAMVIPSLIQRAVNGENPLNVWGDGTAIRDFIHAKDVAAGMMLAVEKEIDQPINLGSGLGISIKQITEIIAANLPNSPIEIHWDKTFPQGDAIRLMDMTRAYSYGFRPKISIEQGIIDTIQWYQQHRNHANRRYNAFTENVYLLKETISL